MGKPKKEFRFERKPEGEDIVIQVLADTAKTATTESVRCAALEGILETLGFEGYKVRKKVFK